MKHGVTLKQLWIFSSVVVAGSITPAARRTGPSQPSISQQLAKLEEQLGPQLILRDRAGQVTLTTPGDYWFKVEPDLLQRYDIALESHSTLFGHDTLSLRLGTTPTLRGRVIGMAARIALDIVPGARFVHRWGFNSSEVVERLRLHQLNCALVNRTILEPERGSFSVTPPLTDTMAWVVPTAVPETVLRDAVAEDAAPCTTGAALTRHVTLPSDAPVWPAANDWYRRHLPQSAPAFSVHTYFAAIDLVAKGLATTHCPVSLPPNLPASFEGRLRWYRIDGLTRDIVLAMPRHLPTLTPYARVHAARC